MVIAWLLGACSTTTPEVRVETPHTLVIGHRGSPGHLPDHTLEGYRLAVAQGADFIEPDLVPTKDGVLVARHENDLSHTTDVAKRFPDRRATKTVDGAEITGWFAEDLTLEELRTLRAVQPFPSRPHDHDGRYGIPTFAEVLALRAELEKEAGRPIGVYPELKHPTYFRALGMPSEPGLIAALRDAGLVTEDAPVFVQSFEPTSLDRVAAELPVRRILLVDDLDASPADGSPTWGDLLADLPALRARVHGIGVHTSHVWTAQGPNDLVERAHAAGLAVHVYTFRMEPEKLGFAAEGDPRRELRRFYELGVDGVFADYPDV
ncbi:MAG: glycerophosphodiester phosphodiesterase, partial [Myxococcales bacterium]|nr:glycerophosphodiester phosphodiesterase [Myxococcales bacterium]